MLIRRLIPVGLLALVATALPVSAQTAAPTKIAVANATSIFGQLQEVKDLQVKLTNEQRTITAEAQRRKADLDNLANTRSQFKMDSQQWSEANTKYNKQAVEDQAWADLTKMDELRQAKLQTKQIFDEIQAEAGDVAKQAGFDMVLCQNSPDLTNLIEDPQVNLNQFQAAVRSNNVLFANNTVDISDKIVTALDAKYKSSGGAASPTPGK
ncbi:MAG TPA: OmpH family outer membrane protein [Tepidisphaeraceae bacterium]|jgi:Skp family chaperone for outer membrane proteins